MKLIGDEMLNSGDVVSTEFADNNVSFNHIKANNISEIDLQTVNNNNIIATRDDHTIHYYNAGADSWDDWELATCIQDRVTLNSDGDQFNYIHFLNDAARFLEVDNLLLQDLDNVHNFVIDWWMFQYAANDTGCLLFNGSTSSPDPVTNKELCITTSGDIVDPDTLGVTPNPADDGYLNILYPPLKSNNPINNDRWHHCALVSNDGQLQLIIDSKVNDEVTFDNISDVENVLLGAGYSNGFEGYVGKIRITKGTNLGWYGGGFDLPDNDYIADGNTEFLMDSTSLVDTTANYAITVNGAALSIYQDNHYIYLKPSYLNKTIVTFDFSSTKTVYLPPGNDGVSLSLINIGEPVNLKAHTDDTIHSNINSYFWFAKHHQSVTIQHVINTWISTNERCSKVRDYVYFINTVVGSARYYFSAIFGQFENYGSASNGIILTGLRSNEKFDSTGVNLDTPKIIDVSGGTVEFLNALAPTTVIENGDNDWVDNRSIFTFYMRYIGPEVLSASAARTICTNNSSEWFRLYAITGTHVQWQVGFGGTAGATTYISSSYANDVHDRWLRVYLRYYTTYNYSNSPGYQYRRYVQVFIYDAQIGTQLMSFAAASSNGSYKTNTLIKQFNQSIYWDISDFKIEY